MSGIVAQFKKCPKCKNIYDANSGMGLFTCPYCLLLPKRIPTPGKKRPPHWPF